MTREQITRRILDRLFRAAGFKRYNAAWVARHTDWYRRRTWTVREENKFRRWLEVFLRRHVCINRRQAKLWSGMFLLNCGWRTKIK